MELTKISPALLLWTGCANNTLFHYEREWHGLYTLSTQPIWGRKTALYKKEASCVLNTSSSWVIGCHGEKIPVDELTNRTKKIFVLEWSNKSGAYYIKVIKILKSTSESLLRYQTIFSFLILLLKDWRFWSWRSFLLRKSWFLFFFLKSFKSRVFTSGPLSCTWPFPNHS